MGTVRTFVNWFSSDPVDAPAHRDESSEGTILVGFDGSHASLHALVWAGGEARRTNRRVIAVHVVPPTGSMVMTTLTAQCSSIVDEVFETTCQELEVMAHQVGQEVGVPIEFVRGLGDPCRELIRIATSAGADLVVVGRSQKTLHRVAGSVARRLVGARSAPIVIVVP